MMYYTTLLSLLVLPAMSKAFKAYSAPFSLQAKDCILPANFTVSNFTIYTDSTDSSKNYTKFSYSDAATGIDTLCRHDSASKPGTTANSWPCDNQNVSFIYDAAKPTPELSLIEIACPESGGNFEATGSVYPNMTCTNSTSDSTCIAQQGSTTGVFVSLEPMPPTSR
ncbi:hypothetical protein GGR52DRAFT_349676 [Hypoxylon sp. FL1284]|nr:hypothetical protein GGR52DRAFT_349676 [Hypoxylon sp. FL1284]